MTLEKGRLYAQATNQPKFPIFASSETKFFYKVVDAQLVFTVDKDGKATRLELHQGGGIHAGVKE